MSSSKRPTRQNSPAEIQINTNSTGARAWKRPKKPAWQSPAVLIGGTLVVILVVVGLLALNGGEEPKAEVRITVTAPATVDEHAPYELHYELSCKYVDKQAIAISLADQPVGMSLEPSAQRIRWIPAESDGPGEYTYRIVATHRQNNRKLTTKSIRLSVREVSSAPEISLSQTSVEGQPGKDYTIPMTATDPDIPTDQLQWEVSKSPDVLQSGLTATTGLDNSLKLQLPMELAAGSYEIEVTVRKALGQAQNPSSDRRGNLSSSASLRLTVLPTASPFDELRLLFAETPFELRDADDPRLAIFDVPEERFRLNGENLTVYAFESATAAREAVQQIHPETGTVAGREIQWQAAPRIFQSGRYVGVYLGETLQTLSALQRVFGTVAVQVSLTKPQMEQPDLPEVDPLEKTVVSLYRKNKSLFQPKSYEELRRVFAERVWTKFQPQVETALGEDTRPMLQWFEENPEVKEELCLAIDAESDKSSRVFQIFNELRKVNADKLRDYSNLGIAIAVCWDQPNAVYDYAHHARRTGSSLPNDLSDALANYQYFLDVEKAMQGRAQWLPWEFQLHLINHRTPSKERVWAVNSYLNKRAMIGKCYSEVPYDYQMLNTSSRECRLGGKEYNLPNLRQFGGVCAMQADFSSRVGKSLGVPAAYVGGQSRFGDLHAWVMWVEILSVTRTSIRFSLESHGRYRGDRYYVGTLREPQTGKTITDRDLELTLQAVGSNPRGYRQSRLIMQAYPLIAKAEDFDLEEKFDFLKRVIALSPGNRTVWVELGKLSASPDVETRHRRLFRLILNQFFLTFAAFPDFTWEVFENLTSWETDAAQRIKLYERLLAVYVAAGRPDLASRARLTLTDMLVEADRLKEATQGLAVTILKFADEGRFVVTLLDRLEELAKQVENSDQELVQFYIQFLKKIPRKRGNSPSEYCIKMYRRGINKLQSLNQPVIAAQLKSELQKIEAGQ